MRIEYIKISNLVLWKDNPEKRTTKEALKGLKENISTYGLKNPLHITESLVVADGNRRLRCATELGYTEVPCIIHYGYYEDTLFNILNGDTRRVVGGDYASLFISGNTGAIPKKHLREIEALKERAYPRTFESICASARSPKSINGRLKLVSKAVGGIFSEADILDWLHFSSQQNDARSFLDNGGDPSVLVYAIKNSVSVAKAKLDLGD